MTNAISRKKRNEARGGSPPLVKKGGKVILSDSKAKKAWTAAHTTRIVMNLNNNTDADILQKLKEVENKQGYIKSIIRADIAKEQ